MWAPVTASCSTLHFVAACCWHPGGSHILPEKAVAGVRHQCKKWGCLSAPNPAPHPAWRPLSGFGRGDAVPSFVACLLLIFVYIVHVVASARPSSSQLQPAGAGPVAVAGGSSSSWRQRQAQLELAGGSAARSCSSRCFGSNSSRQLQLSAQHQAAAVACACAWGLQPPLRTGLGCMPHRQKGQHNFWGDCVWECCGRAAVIVARLNTPDQFKSGQPHKLTYP